MSRRTLTKEEREALAKQREAETKEAEKIASAWRKAASVDGGPACNPAQTRSPGAWQSSRRRGVRRHRHLALVHRADVPFRSGRAWQRRPRGRARHAVAGLLVDYADHYRQICAHRHAHRQQWRRRHLRTVFADSQAYGAWLAIPAMLGGAAFLADSVLTPAVSISSAVEGLQTLPPLEGLFDENPT